MVPTTTRRLRRQLFEHVASAFQPTLERKLLVLDAKDERFRVGDGEAFSDQSLSRLIRKVDHSVEENGGDGSNDRRFATRIRWTERCRFQRWNVPGRRVHADFVGHVYFACARFLLLCLCLLLCLLQNNTNTLKKNQV